MLDFVVDRIDPVVTDTSIAPTTITVAFDDSGGMDPTTVTDPALYGLIASGGDGAFGDAADAPLDLAAALIGIAYDTPTRTAVLTFADGSVHFIEEAISFKLFNQLGTRAGGEIISLP